MGVKAERAHSNQLHTHTHTEKLLPSITNNAVMIESADVQNGNLELHTNATVPGWFVASKSTAHVEKQSK